MPELGPCTMVPGRPLVTITVLKAIAFKCVAAATRNAVLLAAHGKTKLFDPH